MIRLDFEAMGKGSLPRPIGTIRDYSGLTRGYWGPIGHYQGLPRLLWNHGLRQPKSTVGMWWEYSYYMIGIAKNGTKSMAGIQLGMLLLYQGGSHLWNPKNTPAVLLLDSLGGNWGPSSVVGIQQRQLGA